MKAKTVENNPSERIGLLLVLLIASVLRLVSLHTLPPGLHHDEAWYAVDALDVLQGHHAIYFENNTGREPLYIYLVALSYELLGPGTLQLRLVSAILGVATVAAIYLLGRELHGRVVGLIAAFVLATLFWHVSFSRLGLRAITLPLLETVAAWLLYRAAQSSSRRCWAAAGLAVGLTLFTYTASRAVPIWVGLFIAFAALVRRNDGLPRRDLLAGAAVAAVVAAGVFAPLGLYAVSHPDRFAGRMGDVSILTAAREQAVQEESILGKTIENLTVSVFRTTKMFITEGDYNLRNNLPNRAVFDEFLSIFFVVGLVTTVRHIRRPSHFLCLVWLVSMLIPGFLAIEAPNFVRTIGVIPPACILAAVGIGSVLARVRQHRHKLLATGVPLLIALGLCYSSWRTTHDYFLVWARHPDITYTFAVDQIEASCLASKLESQGVAVLSASPHPATGITQYACPRRDEPSRLFDGRRSLVVPERTGTEGLYYIFPRTFTPADRRHCQWLPCQEPLQVVHDVAGSAAVEAFELPPESSRWLKPSFPTAAKLGAHLEVTGYDVDRHVVPGGVVRLSLHTKILRGFDETEDWKLFAHLIDRNGRSWASALGERLLPHGSWRPGDTYVAYLDLVTPPNLPAGAYHVRVGAFESGSLRHLPVIDGRGREIGEIAHVGLSAAQQGMKMGLRRLKEMLAPSWCCEPEAKSERADPRNN